ncbi:hypothetical protein O3G_MSEX000114, partial [Manduca sexta]
MPHGCAWTEFGTTTPTIQIARRGSQTGHQQMSLVSYTWRATPSALLFYR